MEITTKTQGQQQQQTVKLSGTKPGLQQRTTAQNNR